MLLFNTTRFKQIGFLALFLSGISLAAAQGAPPYHVNCGGAAFTDGAGTAWESDLAYVTGGVKWANLLAPVVGDASLLPMYQTEMFYEPEALPLSYNFPAAPGEYTVRLHFAEIWEGIPQAGARVFNIVINGVVVESNFDVFTAAGGANIAIYKDYTTTSTGTITIGLVNVTWKAKINGIEIAAPGTLGVKNSAVPQKSLQFAANSANGSFSVVAPFSGKYSLTVRDIHGAIVAQKSVFGNASQSLNDLKAGVYFVSAQSGNRVISNKVSLVR